MDQSTSVPDGQTDGQTDRIAITKTAQRIASRGKNLATHSDATTLWNSRKSLLTDICIECGTVQLVSRFHWISNADVRMNQT